MSVTDVLTPKQRRFVAEYLVDLNATQAAIRAGYSPRTARVTGPETLSKPVVAAAIARAQAERATRVGIVQDDVLRRLIREADREGPGASHAARVSAIVALGRHIGMFGERTEHGVTAELLAIGRALCDVASRAPAIPLHEDPRILALEAAEDGANPHR